MNAVLTLTLIKGMCLENRNQGYSMIVLITTMDKARSHNPTDTGNSRITIVLEAAHYDHKS